MSESHPPRTPLRRLSHGSLSGLARSVAHYDQDTPTGLGFLDHTIPQLNEEADALQANIESLNELSASLAVFNESFGGFLAMMKADACCLEFPEFPTDESFALARRRAFEANKRMREQIAAREAEAAAAAAANLTTLEAADDTHANQTTYGNSTTPGRDRSAVGLASVDGKLKPALKKPSVKAKTTAKDKRARDLAIEAAINQMPLEFRSADPDTRRTLDMLIGALMDASSQALSLPTFVKPPQLTQAKVNKFFIALVGSKLLQKTVGPTKQALYQWRGPLAR